MVKRKKLVKTKIINFWGVEIEYRPYIPARDKARGKNIDRTGWMELDYWLPVLKFYAYWLTRARYRYQIMAQMNAKCEFYF